MNGKKSVYVVPVASTDFTREAFLDCSGLTPIIRYAYNGDLGEYQCGIKFNQVSAFRKRSERCCGSWHIEGAYDTLVEVESSSWITEVLNDVPEPYRENWKPRHFMIYLDSVGAFEFLSESWEELPEIVVERAD